LAKQGWAFVLSSLRNHDTMLLLSKGWKVLFNIFCLGYNCETKEGQFVIPSYLKVLVWFNMLSLRDGKRYSKKWKKINMVPKQGLILYLEFLTSFWNIIIKDRKMNCSLKKTTYEKKDWRQIIGEFSKKEKNF
jgi:hypothetical protein